MRAGADPERTSERGHHGCEANPQVHAAVCVALELLGDARVVPALVEQLRTAPDAHIFDLVHALWRLTGVSPLVAPSDTTEALRETWIRAVERGPVEPRLREVAAAELGTTFAVDEGRGRLRIDYAPPAKTERTWPRWSRSLFVGEQALYDVGSTCGTCETVLSLIGWPESRALVIGEALRRTLADRPVPDAAWLSAWAPVLGALETGRYLACSLEVPVDRVDDPAASWLHRRREWREDDDDWPDEDDGPPHACTPHYQPPVYTPGDAFTVLAPSQPLDALDEATVERFGKSIREGARPGVLALGWKEDRYVRARWDEEVLVLCLLDGHHKLEAYARAGVDAWVVSLFALDHTWGPPDDRAGALRATVQRLAPRATTVRSDRPAPRDDDAT